MHVPASTNISRVTAVVLWFAIAGVMDACTSSLIVADQAPSLQPGEGIAAVVLDTVDSITQVELVPASGKGGKLNIPAARPGRSLFLIVAPAGSYCMHQFHYNDLTFKANNDSICFDLAAGHISYSGDFAPRVVEGTVVWEHIDHYPAFMRLLQASYPRVAAKVPLAPR